MDENPPHGPEEVYSVYNFPHSPFVDIKEVKTVSTRYLRMCGGWSGEWRRTKRNIHTHSKTNTNLSDSTYFCLTFFFFGWNRINSLPFPFPVNVRVRLDADAIWQLSSPGGKKNKNNQTYVPLGMSRNIPFGHVRMQQHPQEAELLCDERNVATV